ncbi:MAG: nitrile hydratase subunit alpha [Pseudomonadota bacterium]|nr:nitrile hydratase subunit alpha [Pseudomonadota bacterium]
MNVLQADSAALYQAITKLLCAKGVLSEAEIAQQRTAFESASPGQGARMVARAWTDPDFRTQLLRDGTAAAEAMSIPMRGMPPLGVLENTEEFHHLVVCTLCSCYPKAVLGYPPYWYKSAAYRARAVRDPRGLLAEFGTILPAGVKVRVVDSTADFRWMVLPKRPDGTQAWSLDQLAAIVSPGDMIGVTLPKAG